MPIAPENRQQVWPLLVRAEKKSQVALGVCAPPRPKKEGPIAAPIINDATSFGRFANRHTFGNSSRGASAHYEMQHQRNDCKQEQQMDQSSGNMKDGKTANPRDK